MTSEYKLDETSDQALRDAPFLDGRTHDDYNVISVDWGRLARSPCYIQATKNVVLAGLCTAQLIKALVRARSIPLSSIHVIGFSLGAQVSGQVATFLRPRKLTRITGLDPAMPLFASLKRSTVLDRTDADFVDIIHTNAGNKGKYGPNGHVDFYVNGGTMQPGCVGPEVYDSASCAHARAPIYYAESLWSQLGFWGQECSSWFAYRLGMCSWREARYALMGEFADPTIHGQFFLDTFAKSPFAMGRLRTRTAALSPNNQVNNEIQ
ncbi:hypothetical protein B566_EDAN010433 [Ephemera danica]|nr:hypothetical protein B566_EDAN010433 [Ephemera danica]